MADDASLSFAARIKLKQNSGYDKNIKERVPQLRDQADNLKQKSEYKPSKNMPKQHFSKLPVSVIKVIKGRNDGPSKPVVRDPRFDAQAGTLNKGMFEKSYGFVADLQRSRLRELKDELKHADKIGDFEARTQIKQLLGDERALLAKQRQQQAEKEVIVQVKAQNKDRAAEGKQAVFVKKREIKELKLKKQFDELDKSGRLDKHLKGDDHKKKRQRR